MSRTGENNKQILVIIIISLFQKLSGVLFLLEELVYFSIVVLS